MGQKLSVFVVTCIYVTKPYNFLNDGTVECWDGNGNAIWTCVDDEDKKSECQEKSDDKCASGQCCKLKKKTWIYTPNYDMTSYQDVGISFNYHRSGSAEYGCYVEYSFNNWNTYGTHLTGTDPAGEYQYNGLIPALDGQPQVSIALVAWEEDCYFDNVRIYGTLTPAPTNSPTGRPTPDPSSSPSKRPTLDPSASPSIRPTDFPTSTPTVFPTNNPTETPTTRTPTLLPTNNPSMTPTGVPSLTPTISPTRSFTLDPTKQTLFPTYDPTVNPTISPTVTPTKNPTNLPTINPTGNPILSPSLTPTSDPSVTPTYSPSLSPSVSPTDMPTTVTLSPTINPTQNPTVTMNPTAFPTSAPTSNPSTPPTMSPTKSSAPTITPTVSPTPFDDNASGADGFVAQKRTNAPLIIFAVGIVILLLCCLVIFIVLYRRRQTKYAKDVISIKVAQIAPANVVRIASSSAHVMGESVNIFEEGKDIELVTGSTPGGPFNNDSNESNSPDNDKINSGTIYIYYNI